ncbi:MAG: N-acetyltransferase family protein [Actinomycetota bacterium]
MIRPAAAADLPALRVLWDRYREETGEGADRDADAWGQWMLPRISAGDVRVGLVERRVAAYVAWQAVTAPPGPRDLRIVELYVHPSGRGQRIGSGLLARAIDAASQRACGRAVLTGNVHDEAVRSLAEPFGFALDGEALVLPLRQG